MDSILLLAQVILFGTSLLLLALNIYTYRITGNTKVLVAGGAFAVFALQALLLFFSEFVAGLSFMARPRTLLMINTIAVIIFYAATVRTNKTTGTA